MAKVKVIKKQWYPILAPKIFQNAVLGETHVYEPEQMVGKCITKNLMNLTNDVKRQNININFKVVNVQNNKAFTNVVGYYMVPSMVRRLVRRNIEKINMSFLCKTSDNKNLHVKPLLITRSATKGSIAARMRKNAQDFLVKYIGEVSYDNFVNDLINHKIQNSLKRNSNKIYPLRVCEIKSMEVVDLEKKEQIKSKAKSDKLPKPKLTKKAEEGKSTGKKEEEVKENKETAKKEEKTEQKA